MAVTNINQILEWFKTGKKPTQAQFWATWGSFWHKHEGVVVKHPTSSEISGGLKNLEVITIESNVKIPTSDGYEGSMNDLANSKADLIGGKVPAAQLPSYVDDVIEVASFSSLPTTGETGKIYLTIDTNFTYRWGGTSYIKVSELLSGTADILPKFDSTGTGLTDSKIVEVAGNVGINNPEPTHILDVKIPEGLIRPLSGTFSYDGYNLTGNGTLIQSEVAPLELIQVVSTGLIFSIDVIYSETEVSASTYGNYATFNDEVCVVVPSSILKINFFELLKSYRTYGKTVRENNEDTVYNRAKTIYNASGGDIIDETSVTGAYNYTKTFRRNGSLIGLITTFIEGSLSGLFIAGQNGGGIRYYFNQTLKITGLANANGDSTFTKQLVIKPDGSIGVADKPAKIDKAQFLGQLTINGASSISVNTVENTTGISPITVTTSIYSGNQSGTQIFTTNLPYNGKIPGVTTGDYGYATTFVEVKDSAISDMSSSPIVYMHPPGDASSMFEYKVKVFQNQVNGMISFYLQKKNLATGAITNPKIGVDYSYFLVIFRAEYYPYRQ